MRISTFVNGKKLRAQIWKIGFALRKRSTESTGFVINGSVFSRRAHRFIRVCHPILWTFSSSLLFAQQAIINMPSADITPRGKNFLMHETQWRWQQPGPYWYGTNFYCYGIGHATELTLTNYNTGVPSSPDFSTGIGFKSSPVIFKDRFPEREIKLTIGQKAIFSHRGAGLGSFSYGHLSGRIPKLETRITAGAFASTRQLAGRATADFLGGVEQPLGAGGKIVFVNEWFRGRHDLGFFITGLLVHPGKHIFVIAYKFPNVPANGRSGLVLEYGLFF